jgi:hypothetical protein
MRRSERLGFSKKGESGFGSRRAPRGWREALLYLVCDTICLNIGRPKQAIFLKVALRCREVGLS